MSRILITGSEGVIGKIVSEELKREHKLIPVDRNIGIDILTTDIINYFKNVDYLIHLAANPAPNINNEEAEIFQVICDYTELQKVQGVLEEKGVEIESSGIGYLPQNWLVIKDLEQAKQVMRFLETLEDDDDVRATAISLLQELGYTVLHAHDGQSALALIEGGAHVEHKKNKLDFQEFQRNGLQCFELINFLFLDRRELKYCLRLCFLLYYYLDLIKK